jgi:hypothetical protein
MKTRNAVFISAGSLTLLSILLSRFNRNWLWLAGLTGTALIEAGFSDFCGAAYLFEKYKLTKPDHGHYERDRLKDIHKLKVIKKMRKIRREVSDYIKEAEAKKTV